MLKAAWTNGLPEGHNGGAAYRPSLGTGTRQPYQPYKSYKPYQPYQSHKACKPYKPCQAYQHYIQQPPLSSHRFFAKNFPKLCLGDVPSGWGCVRDGHLVSKFPSEKVWKVCWDSLQRRFAQTCGQTMGKNSVRKRLQFQEATSGICIHPILTTVWGFINVRKTTSYSNFVDIIVHKIRAKPSKFLPIWSLHQFS